MTTSLNNLNLHRAHNSARCYAPSRLSARSITASRAILTEGLKEAGKIVEKGVETPGGAPHLLYLRGTEV